MRSLAFSLVVLSACALTPSRSSLGTSMNGSVVVGLRNDRRQSNQVTVHIDGASGATFALFSDRTFEPQRAAILRERARECFEQERSYETCQRQLSGSGTLLAAKATKRASEPISVTMDVSPPLDFDADWSDDWDGFVILVRVDDDGERSAHDRFRVTLDVESRNPEHGATEVELEVVEQG